METNRILAGKVDQELAELRAARRCAVLEHAFVDATARQRLDGLHRLVREAISVSIGSVLLLRVLADVAHELRAMDDHDATERNRADAAILDALNRLRAMDSSGEMSRRAPGELREACGFTRVMISSAHGSRWMPDTMRPTDHADPDAAEFARFAQDDNEIPLARLMPETEMVRRRVSVLVPGSNSHAYKPLVRVTQSTSYVAAPIVTTRRVIGFFHADRIGKHNDVTQGDRDSVSAFASEFGVMFEHATLAERSNQQRADWAATLRTTIEGLETMAVSARSPLPPDAALAGPPVAAEIDTIVDRSRLLTERERQVVMLVAAGATNKIIARELVLSVDTVKTHVKNVMGKLRATSRAEAVARYLQSRVQPMDLT